MRLSEDGVLIFRLDGVDVPVFDFSMPSIGLHSNDVREFFARDLPSGHPDPRGIPFITRQMRDMFRRVELASYPDRLDIFVNPAYRNQALEVAFNFEPDWDIPSEWSGHPFTPTGSVRFMNGFGMRGFSEIWEDLHYWEVFRNSVSAVSAVISGKEVSRKEAREKLLLLVEPDLPPVVGQRDTLSRGSGAFDFSKGTFRESDEDSISVDPQIKFEQGHDLFSRSYILESSMGIADLGEIDFGHLVAEGFGQVDPGSFSLKGYPREGHVYAVRTPEGGLAMMHVVLVVEERWRGYLRRIVFDWVYYPTFANPVETSIKSITWGELKNSLCCK